MLTTKPAHFSAICMVLPAKEAFHCFCSIVSEFAPACTCLHLLALLALLAPSRNFSRRAATTTVVRDLFFNSDSRFLLHTQTWLCINSRCSSQLLCLFSVAVLAKKKIHFLGCGDRAREEEKKHRPFLAISATSSNGRLLVAVVTYLFKLFVSSHALVLDTLC